MDAVKRINILFPKYLDRQITATEWEELLVWMSALSEEDLTALSHSQQYLWQKAKAGELPSTADKVNWDKILSTILSSEEDANIAPVVHRVHFLKTSWFRYAAAVIILAGGAAIWYNQSQKSSEATVQTKDIAPGTNRAILTIGNNKPIDLAANKTGIAVTNNIAYTDGEKIANPSDPLFKGEAGQLLQLTTPRGGQYQAVLPDGTKVWLNAASSIKFPSRFEGDKREVEINGEAYLEIAKNTSQPFFVHTSKETIQVLGTSFNVNAYSDEEVTKTTLIEGSIRVKTTNEEIILKPNQQAITNNQTNQAKTLVQTINTDNEIAWVKGYFYFDKADVKTILRQISRWYDLDIVYTGQAPEDLFSGKIERNIPLSGMIHFLEQNNVKVKVEGRKLIVSSQ